MFVSARLADWWWSAPTPTPGPLTRWLRRLDDRALSLGHDATSPGFGASGSGATDGPDQLGRAGRWSDLSVEQRAVPRRYVAKGFLNRGKRTRQEEVEKLVRGGPTVVAAWLTGLPAAIAYVNWIDSGVGASGTGTGGCR